MPLIISFALYRQRHFDVPISMPQGAEAPPWMNCRWPLRSNVWYLRTLLERGRCVHQTASMRPGVWSSGALLPGCVLLASARWTCLTVAVFHTGSNRWETVETDLPRRFYIVDYVVLLGLTVALIISETSVPYSRFIFHRDDSVSSEALPWCAVLPCSSPFHIAEMCRSYQGCYSDMHSHALEVMNLSWSQCECWSRCVPIPHVWLWCRNFGGTVTRCTKTASPLGVCQSFLCVGRPQYL